MATEREVEQSLKNIQADITNLDVRLEFAERRVQAIRHTNFVENFLSGLTDLGALGFISSHLDWKHVASPVNPSSGFQRIFADTDNSGHLTSRNSSGTEVDLEYLDADAIAAVEGEATLLLSGSVSVALAFVLSGDISPAQITADTNNYNPTNLDTSSTLRVSTDASRNLTGIVPAAPSDGRVLILHNIGSQNLVLIDESASSSAANRFALSGNVTLSGDESIVLQYDSTSSRWRIIGAGAGTYTDAEAILAVEGEATLVLTGDVSIASGKNLSLLTDGSTGGVKFGASGDVVLFRGSTNRLDLGTGDSLEIVSGNINIGGNLTLSGTVDGVDIAARDHSEAHDYDIHSGGVPFAELEYDDATSDPLIDADAASDGAENSAARKDHVHPKHHTKYTDAAAIAAVEGEATLVLSGSLSAQEIFATKSTLTIDANDEITVPTTAWVYLTSAGATDNLDGIGSGTEGQIVFLTVVAGKDITLIHNGTVTAGDPLLIAGEANALLDQDHDMAIAVYDAVATAWNVAVISAAHAKYTDAEAVTAIETDGTVVKLLGEVYT